MHLLQCKPLVKKLKQLEQIKKEIMLMRTQFNSMNMRFRKDVDVHRRILEREESKFTNCEQMTQRTIKCHLSFYCKYKGGTQYNKNRAIIIMEVKYSIT